MILDFQLALNSSHYSLLVIEKKWSHDNIDQGKRIVQ